TLQMEGPQIFENKIKSTNFEGASSLLRIMIKGDSATAPILSEITSAFDMDVRIIGAKLDHIGETNFGVMLIKITGHKFQLEQAIHFLQQEALKTEITGYV